MNRCKYCKYCREDSRMNSSNMAIGIVIFGFPMPPTYDEYLECTNRKSSYYLDDVDEYDSCNYFEEK